MKSDIVEIVQKYNALFMLLNTNSSVFFFYSAWCKILMGSKLLLQKTVSPLLIKYQNLQHITLHATLNFNEPRTLLTFYIL